MRRAQDLDDMRSLNSLQPLRRLIVFLSFKYRLCSKVILRRCMFRPLKRRAILPPRRLLFFSRQSAAVRQMIVRRSMFRHLKKTNFCQTKEATEITHLQHRYPFVNDQLALCALAMEGTLKYLKLHMQQWGRDNVRLDIPLQPVRWKAPYSALLKHITNNCTWRKYP